MLAVVHLISINRYLHINAESVGEGQDFGIGNCKVSISSPMGIDQSCLSMLCLHANEQSLAEYLF